MGLESGDNSGEKIENRDVSVTLIFAETVNPEIAGAVRNILINAYLKQRR